MLSSSCELIPSGPWVMFPVVGQPRGQAAGGLPIITVAVVESRTGDWPSGVATTLTVLMTIESLNLSSVAMANDASHDWFAGITGGQLIVIGLLLASLFTAKLDVSP